MIHWGSDVPGQTSRSATPPSGYYSEDELAIVRPIREKRVWASNPRLAASLSQLNLASAEDQESSGCRTSCDVSNCSSQSNLVATMWLNRQHRTCGGLLLNKDYSLEASENSSCPALEATNKLVASRCRSRSLEDVSRGASKGPSCPEIMLDIDAPPSVHENQDLAVYMSLINRSSSPITLSASFRVDAGLRKIKTKTQHFELEAKKTTQLSLLLPAGDLWQLLKRNEKHFTVIATAHNHNDGTVLSKIDHVKIHWRKLSLTRTTRNLFLSPKTSILGC